MDFFADLFDNAGKKLRDLAVGFFIVESLAAIIGGIVMMAEDSDLIGYALLTIVGGIIVAYLSGLFLSAFGELVENTTANKEINEQLLINHGGAITLSGPRSTTPTKPINRAAAANAPARRPAAPVAPAAPAEPEAPQASATTQVSVDTPPATVYCPKCGASQFAGRKNCWKCGAGLE